MDGAVGTVYEAGKDLGKGLKKALKEGNTEAAGEAIVEAIQSTETVIWQAHAIEGYSDSRTHEELGKLKHEADNRTTAMTMGTYNPQGIGMLKHTAVNIKDIRRAANKAISDEERNAESRVIERDMDILQKKMQGDEEAAAFIGQRDEEALQQLDEKRKGKEAERSGSK